MYVAYSMFRTVCSDPNFTWLEEILICATIRSLTKTLDLSEKMSILNLVKFRANCVHHMTNTFELCIYVIRLVDTNTAMRRCRHPYSINNSSPTKVA